MRSNFGVPTGGIIPQQIDPPPDNPVEVANGFFPHKDNDLIYKKKIIKLIVEGGFESIEDLITRLDNYKKLLEIQSIRIEQEGHEAKIRASFELAMYVLSQ